jgi:predicted RNA-binding protein YlqC (UPF0109 family)
LFELCFGGEMGLIMKQLLITLAQGLVENPDSVTVTENEPLEDGTIVYHLHVADGDMGRVIGKQGRIAKAIRSVMRAAASKQNIKIAVEID